MVCLTLPAACSAHTDGFVPSKASRTCVRGKCESQFMLELITLCSIAEKRNQFESDLYPLWDTVGNNFASLLNNPDSETIISVTAQYTLDHKFLNARGSMSHHVKIPDDMILKLDDTPQRKFIFWAELKRLWDDFDNWFTIDGKIAANNVIENMVKQTNTQAQYALAHFNLQGNASMYTFIISGPYFVLVEYRVESMSPGFFTREHARQGAAVTRSQIQNDEFKEDPLEDDHTTPFYPYGTDPYCLFDVTDAELEAGNYQLTQGVKLNPMLLQALGMVLRNHEDIRSRMQRVDWFDV